MLLKQTFGDALEVIEGEGGLEQLAGVGEIAETGETFVDKKPSINQKPDDDLDKPMNRTLSGSRNPEMSQSEVNELERSDSRVSEPDNQIEKIMNLSMRQPNYNETIPGLIPPSSLGKRVHSRAFTKDSDDSDDMSDTERKAAKLMQ